MRTNKELRELTLDNDWIIRYILPRGGKCMIAGPPKVGKSYLVLNMANAVCAKQEFFHGYAVETYGTALYIQLDMALNSHRRRIIQLEANGYDFSKLFHITPDEVGPGFSLIKEGNLNWLKEQVRDLKPTLIIFDVFKRFFTGDENDSDMAQQAISAIDELLLEGDSTGIILHHSRKQSEMSKSLGMNVSPIDAVRGSSVIAGSMDTIMAFNDNGSMLAVQGRDINTVYNIKRNKWGLHERYIKKTHQQRATALERLLALFLVQKPGMDEEYYYVCATPLVEDLDYEEFKARFLLIKDNPYKDEWM